MPSGLLHLQSGWVCLFSAQSLWEVSGILSWQTTGGWQTRGTLGVAQGVALCNETKRRMKKAFKIAHHYIKNNPEIQLCYQKASRIILSGYLIILIRNCRVHLNSFLAQTGLLNIVHKLGFSLWPFPKPNVSLTYPLQTSFDVGLKISVLLKTPNCGQISTICPSQMKRNWWNEWRTESWLLEPQRRQLDFNLICREQSGKMALEEKVS